MADKSTDSSPTPSDSDSATQAMDLGFMGIIASNATGLSKRSGKETALWADVAEVEAEVADDLRRRLGRPQEAPAEAETESTTGDATPTPSPAVESLLARAAAMSPEELDRFLEAVQRQRARGQN